MMPRLQTKCRKSWPEWWLSFFWTSLKNQSLISYSICKIFKEKAPHHSRKRRKLSCTRSETRLRSLEPRPSKSRKKQWPIKMPHQTLKRMLKSVVARALMTPRSMMNILTKWMSLFPHLKINKWFSKLKKQDNQWVLKYLANSMSKKHLKPRSSKRIKTSKRELKTGFCKHSCLWLLMTTTFKL